MPPERFQVADHIVDGQIFGPARRGRFAGAALSVEDDLTSGGHVLSGRRIDETAVIEARPAVDGDKWDLARRTDGNMIDCLITADWSGEMLDQP